MWASYSCKRQVLGALRPAVIHRGVSVGVGRGDWDPVQFLPHSACEMLGHWPPLFALWFSHLKRKGVDALLPSYFRSVQILTIASNKDYKKAASIHRENLLGKHGTVSNSKEDLNPEPQQEQSTAAQNTPAGRFWSCPLVNVTEL